MTPADYEVNRPLTFEPIYLGEKLHVVNPSAHIGLVTLWSKVGPVSETLRQAGIDLDPESSPVAVIANLYGDGLPEMLANLLFNPQIDSLIIWGKNLSDSKDCLLNFFGRGVTDTNSGSGMVRIVGTNRRLPSVLHPSLFPVPPRIVDLGEDLRNPDLGRLRDALITRPSRTPGKRVKIDLPEMKVETKPSAAYNHSLVADTPCEAWREVLFVLSEFGRVNKYDTSGGDRLELLNLRVTVRKPFPESNETLREHLLAPGDLMKYQDAMLDPTCPGDIDYTYGSRLKTHFGLDTLEECSRILKHERGSRHAYIALWDTRRDLKGQEVPCLVSLFFRVYDEALTLTATFRAHNAATAWIRNVYGLVRVLTEMAEGIGVPVGPLVVISESISLRKSEIQKISDVIGLYNKRYRYYKEDPNGHFEITVDDGKIVAVQRFEGLTVNRFEGKTAQAVEHELTRCHAVSETSHALYLGRELTRAEFCLRRGEPYVQS